MLLIMFVSLLCTTLGANSTSHQVNGFNGEIWPRPKHHTKYDLYTIIRPSVFRIVATNHNCDILEQAIKRYTDIIKDINFRVSVDTNNAFVRQQQLKNKNYQGYLDSLQIKLTTPCGKIPKHNMDESYVLVHRYRVAVIQSETVWGVLRGLESFSQLLVFDGSDCSLRLYETKIYDTPKFSHRGLLVDTARHYISVKTIYRILDGMSYNKLNVLHWHIVDNESFPYESVVFPELSAKGAYNQIMTYTKDNIRSIIEYARVRGIRVMPEFDMPAHTQSWGLSHPELLTRCTQVQEFLGPMDPTKQQTYDFIQELFNEIVALFPDKYIHLGGDEVNYECWLNSKNISKFMENNRIERYELLEELFVERVVSQLSKLNASTVIWHDGLLRGIAIPSSTVVQVWAGNHRQLLPKITLAGFKVLLSEGWYLDNFYESWIHFYRVDPLDFVGTPAQKKLVIGGEACMWSESVDDTTIIQAIFPRVSAAAERLWSYYSHLESKLNKFQNIRYRFEEHSCRMKHRGISIDILLSCQANCSIIKSN